MKLKHILYVATLIVASAVTPVGIAAAEQPSFEMTQTQHSFEDTVSAFKSAVKDNQMMVMSEINQAKVLSMTGLNLAGGQSFFIGSPTMGKKAFGMNPAAGAVLPVRVYIWAAQSGETHIGYFKPSTQLTAISPTFKQAGSMMDKTIDAIVNQAAQ